LTREENRRQNLQFMKALGVLTVLVIAGGLIGYFTSATERPASAPTPSPKLGGPRKVDNTYLDAPSWEEKLRGIAVRAGEQCSKVAEVFQNGQRGDLHVWSFRCSNGREFAVTLRPERLATITPCAVSANNGIVCFQKLPAE